MEAVVYLSLAVASMTFTLCDTKLFKPLREWVKARNAFLGKLLCCGYCLGHWLAFALAGIYRPRLFLAWAPLDYFLTAVVIAWLGGLQWVLMCWLMEKAGK